MKHLLIPVLIALLVACSGSDDGDTQAGQDGDQSSSSGDDSVASSDGEDSGTTDDSSDTSDGEDVNTTDEDAGSSCSAGSSGALLEEGLTRRRRRTEGRAGWGGAPVLFLF